MFPLCRALSLILEPVGPLEVKEKDSDMNNVVIRLLFFYSNVYFYFIGENARYEVNSLTVRLTILGPRVIFCQFSTVIPEFSNFEPEYNN